MSVKYYNGTNSVDIAGGITTAQVEALAPEFYQVTKSLSYTNLNTTTAQMYTDRASANGIYLEDKVQNKWYFQGVVSIHALGTASTTLDADAVQVSGFPTGATISLVQNDVGVLSDWDNSRSGLFHFRVDNSTIIIQVASASGFYANHELGMSPIVISMSGTGSIKSYWGIS